MPELDVARPTDLDTDVHWSPAFAGALIAHAVLVLALSLGLNWRNAEQEPVVFEAQLWAPLPQEQAPAPTPSAAAQAVTEPPPEPVPAEAPPPTPPEPAPPPAPEPDPAPMATGDIALKKAQEKQAAQAREQAERERIAKEQAEQARLAKLAADKAERERIAKEKAEQARQAKLAAEKAERERIAKEKAEQARQAKLAAEKAERERIAKAKAEQARQAKLAAEKAERERIAKEKAEQARLEAVTQQMRAEQIQRAAGLAGSSNAKSTTAVSRGPSASYGAKVIASIKPNIIFTGRLSDNPAAVVEVKTAANGEIIGRRLVSSSGVAMWDEAVLRAVDRTRKLPKDESGSTPAELQITFRPND